MRLVLASILVLLVIPAHAQGLGARCERLRGDLASLEAEGPGDDGRVGQYQGAIERQREEIRRTVDYARSIGCEEVPDRQCTTLTLNIRRMQRNLAVLQSQAANLSANASGPREEERQRLVATLDALGCNGPQTPDDRQRSAGLFERFYGSDEADSAYALPPSTQAPQDEAEPESQEASGTMRTICVRKCDGAFFPVSSATNPEGYRSDEESCRRQCPSAEVELYAYDAYSQQAEDAMSTRTGEPLRSMPNAFKFRTSFDPSCSCKAASPGKGLSPAEEALKRLREADKAKTAAPPAEAQGAKATPPGSSPSAEGTAPSRAAAASAPKAAEVKPADAKPAEAKPADVKAADGQKKKVRVVGDPYLPEE